MTHHSELGRCCVVWLRPQVERLVPVRATNLEFDPNDISPSPLSLTAVEQLLRVFHDIEHASKGVNRDASPPLPSRDFWGVVYETYIVKIIRVSSFGAAILPQ